MEETTKDLTNQNAANQKALKGQNAPAAEPRKILAAFASVDGLNVDEHFGHARYWQIYDFSGDGEFVETRKMPPVCGGSCSLYGKRRMCRRSVGNRPCACMGFYVRRPACRRST